MHLDALQSQHCERQYCEQKFSRLDYSYGILVIGGLKNPPPPRPVLAVGLQCACFGCSILLA